MPIRLGATGLLLWAVVAWPLPRIFSQAIPFTHRHTETQTVRPITPGDHLQLLYHFWLGLDTLGGHSPLFHNVYEFNLGKDSDRKQPDLYYLPFSLVYAAIAPLAGHAAGWNAAGLVSVLVGILALGLLARRHTSCAPAVFWAVLIAGVFPYRWITLFTGSPSGFAISFPPLLAYGLDRALRDGSPAGGFWAGLALLCSFTNDLHVFYFSALAIPFFLLASGWRAAGEIPPRPGRLLRFGHPLLPFAVFAALILLIAGWHHQHLEGSVMAGGRPLSEMAAYSPPAIGLIATAPAGMANHVYFGLPLILLLIALGLLPRWISEAPAGKPLPERGMPILFLAAIATVIVLALGIHGPFEGLPIRLLRKIVPKYSMIRQTVKIYCLLPTLLVPYLARQLGDLWAAPRRGWRRALSLVLAAGLSIWTLQQALQITDPGFCRLPTENAAYTAVAGDEKANAGRPPHALALPLWPGASHWTSICEYFIMLSRVRLVNGYAPAVPAGYVENIFKKFESLNHGVASDEQLDELRRLGVRHLIFHANAYPEQVSPFPPAVALRRLTGHPRLALLADDGQTFAFRILPKHPIEHTPHTNWTEHWQAAARHWTWRPPHALAQGQALPLIFRAPVYPASEIRYFLRMAEPSAQPLLLPAAENGVAQLTHPLPRLPDWWQAELPHPLGGRLSAHSGPVQLSHALMTAGDWPPAADPEGALPVTPALLFHFGHSSPGQPTVRFHPQTVPAGLALYGPNLPFPPGIYDIQLTYTLPEGAPDAPGFVRVLTWPDKTLLAEAPLDPARTVVKLPALAIAADPIRLELHYTAVAPLILHSIRLQPATLQLQPAGS